MNLSRNHPPSTGPFRAGARRAAALLAVSLGACGGGGDEPPGAPERLEVFVGPPAATLDPALAEEGQALVVALNALEGLLVPDPATLEPRPGAAELPELSADGRILTFTLRAGRTWADGTPLEAADFVRGWRRALGLRRDGPLPPALAGIAGAQETWLGGLVIERLPAGLDEKTVASALLPYGAVASLELREGGRTALIIPSRQAIRLAGIPGPPDRDALCAWVRRTLPRDMRDARCSLAHAPGEWRGLVRIDAVHRAGDLERARRALEAGRYRGRSLRVVIPAPEEVVAEAVRALDGGYLLVAGKPVDMNHPGEPIRARPAGARDLGVKAVDGRTLEVRLRAPAAEWLAELALAGELLPWPSDAEDPVDVLRRGNGAFPLASVGEDGTLVLRARKPDAPHPRRIVLMPSPRTDEGASPLSVVAQGPPWPGREGSAVTSHGAASGLGANTRGLPLFRALHED